MTELIETRWTRYGNDRVYLRTSDGLDVGHVDLAARTVVVKVPEFEHEVRACLERRAMASTHLRDEPIPTSSGSETIVPTVEARDLVSNSAGTAARIKQEEANAKAPVRNFVARVLGIHTDERAWRVGAKGEVKVGNQLAKLGPEWHVLHAVEVGAHGSDIDHFVIGPPGVFTFNTKCHPDGKAWVAERRVMVNGRRTEYLRNSRFEAERATKLLSTACGKRVLVQAAIVFVDLERFDVKQMPLDVHVTTLHRMLPWLRSLPGSLTSGDVEEIFARARLSTTWLTTPQT